MGWISILPAVLTTSPPDARASFERAILRSSAEQQRTILVYDPAYTATGQAKAKHGVCTDVILRAFAVAGVDLRSVITRDIARNRKAYGVARPDPKIDHRRCRQMIVYFQRHATALKPKTPLQVGDVVFWSTRRGGPVDHVGMIGEGLLPVHHWPGQAVKSEDVLRAWQIRGVFRAKL